MYVRILSTYVTIYPYRKGKVVTTLLQQACNNFVIETVTTLYSYVYKNITTLLQGKAVYNKSVMLNSLYGMPILG